MLIEKQGELFVKSTSTQLTGYLTKIVTTQNAGTPLSNTTGVITASRVYFYEKIVE